MTRFLTFITHRITISIILISLFLFTISAFPLGAIATAIQESGKIAVAEKQVQVGPATLKISYPASDVIFGEWVEITATAHMDNIAEMAGSIFIEFPIDEVGENDIQTISPDIEFLIIPQTTGPFIKASKRTFVGDTFTAKLKVKPQKAGTLHLYGHTILAGKTSGQQDFQFFNIPRSEYAVIPIKDVPKLTPPQITLTNIQVSQNTIDPGGTIRIMYFINADTPVDGVILDANLQFIGSSNSNNLIEDTKNAVEINSAGGIFKVDREFHIPANTQSGWYNLLASLSYNDKALSSVSISSALQVNSASIPAPQPKPPSENPIRGCTDKEANNYNPQATESDGTCAYPSPPSQSITGCMDPSAQNYNQNATKDDKNCIYPQITPKPQPSPLPSPTPSMPSIIEPQKQQTNDIQTPQSIAQPQNTSNINKPVSQQPTPKVSVSISASEPATDLNSPVTIKWNSTNAISCNINGDARPLSGFLTETLKASKKYILSCANNNGTATDEVSVGFDSFSAKEITELDIINVGYPIKDVGSQLYNLVADYNNFSLTKLGLGIAGLIPGTGWIGKGITKEIQYFDDAVKVLPKNIINEADGIPQILLNKQKGDAFRDKVAEELKKSGRIVEKEVVKMTPFGRRVIDIEVKDTQGNLLGGIETKTGLSRYLPMQKAKDAYLKTTGYIVDLIRDIF